MVVMYFLFTSKLLLRKIINCLMAIHNSFYMHVCNFKSKNNDIEQVVSKLIRTHP